VPITPPVEAYSGTSTRKSTYFRWPPDSGYWLGYRIDQSFYARARNKTQALRALLGVMGFRALLKTSG
jgi:hypothetical protein